MGGIFGVASKSDCVMDLFFGIDYHSHLGTRRGGMTVYSRSSGFNRVIHNIENSPFRTKFDKDVAEMEGNLGIGHVRYSTTGASSGALPSGKFCNYNSRQDQ